MNDRSQGASALKEGTIEFMQNRRTLGNDGKGMGEGCNEYDQNGNGIRVVASYQVAIGKNVQRQVQMRTISPAQYFFNFDQEEIKVTNPVDADLLKQAGIEGNVKLSTFPLYEDAVLMRFENIGEHEDPVTIDINMIAKAFSVGASQIEELSLTGNMAIQEKQLRKIQWKTADSPTSETVPADDSGKLELPSQGIRVFRVTKLSNPEEKFM